jgi:transcriptional regulator with GAF, ATPase, and Fis domain
MKVWYDFIASKDSDQEKKIVTVLTQAGVDVYPLGRKPKGGPGIIFFNNETSQLFDLLREVSNNGLERILTVACCASANSEGVAWRLLDAGASDVFAWDHSENPAAEVTARFDRWERVDALVNSAIVKKNLIGHTPLWIATLRQIVEVARFTNAPVLILGESGSGKELLARLIHTLDARPQKGELVVLDCTTIVPELSGSEFFGHERGAYTGAVTHRDGAFALADGGTLFLDEVGELSMTLQAELLRVVQEHTYKRVGSNVWQQTNFRLVCATNRNLDDAEASGLFRHDFYSRIAGWTCRVPSLRERPEDILDLVQHFMKQFQDNEKPCELDPDVSQYLLQRDYPANVRDLRHLVHRIASRHAGDGPITVGDIPESERPLAQPQFQDWRDISFEASIRRALNYGLGLKEVGRAAEEIAERIAMADESGNLHRAAQKLRVTDRALQMRRAARRNGEVVENGRQK